MSHVALLFSCIYHLSDSFGTFLDPYLMAINMQMGYNTLDFGKQEYLQRVAPPNQNPISLINRILLVGKINSSHHGLVG
jgi:hypothetical protein